MSQFCFATTASFSVFPRVSLFFCEVAGLGNPPNEEVLQDSKQRMLEMLETHGAAKNLTVDKLLLDWTNSHCHKVSFC